jgi:hypothetical protein
MPAYRRLAAATAALAVLATPMFDAPAQASSKVQKFKRGTWLKGPLTGLRQRQDIAIRALIAAGGIGPTPAVGTTLVLAPLGSLPSLRAAQDKRRGSSARFIDKHNPAKCVLKPPAEFAAPRHG